MGTFGFGGGDFGGGFDPWSLGFAAIIDAIIAALNYVWQWLLYFINVLWGWIKGIWKWLKGLPAHIKNWLSDFWHNHLYPFLQSVYYIVDGIIRSIRELAHRLNNIILRIRKWYHDHIFKIQKAILDVLSAMRVSLALLRLLHVKWAAKLDADLAKIQGYVTLSITDVLKALNTISSYLGLIVDPGMVIRKDFFTATLFSSLAGLKRAVWFGGNTPLSASQQQAESDDKGLLNPATPPITADGHGGLTFSPAFASMDTNMRAAARDYVPGA